MRKRHGIAWKWGYIWVTLALFLFSLVGHWVFAWFDYVEEQHAHGQPLEAAPYVVKTLEATFENWQSEFLQLIWQVAGLMILYCVGSPQSKEGEERSEEKLDWIMRALDRQEAERQIRLIEERFPKK